jgi:hypothetical protein
MPRSHRPPVALSRTLLAWLAVATLLLGVFEIHTAAHSFGHAVPASESLEVSEVGHLGQALHVEATETNLLAPCPACLHAQNPSLVFDLAPLRRRGGPRGVLADAEPSVLPRCEFGCRSARAPPRS